MTSSASARSCPPPSSSSSASASSATPPPSAGTSSGHDRGPAARRTAVPRPGRRPRCRTRSARRPRGRPPRRDAGRAGDAEPATATAEPGAASPSRRSRGGRAERADGRRGGDAGPAAPPRRADPLAAALIGVLTLLLGFAFAVQVRTVGDDQQLAGAREEDLVRILDELNAREERLRDQIADQRSALAAAHQLRQPVGDGAGGGPRRGRRRSASSTARSPPRARAWR